MRSGAGTGDLLKGHSGFRVISFQHAADGRKSLSGFMDTIRRGNRRMVRQMSDHVRDAMIYGAAEFKVEWKDPK